MIVERFRKDLVGRMPSGDGHVGGEHLVVVLKEGQTGEHRRSPCSCGAHLGSFVERCGIVDAMLVKDELFESLTHTADTGHEEDAFTWTVHHANPPIVVEHDDGGGRKVKRPDGFVEVKHTGGGGLGEVGRRTVGERNAGGRGTRIGSRGPDGDQRVILARC